MSYVQYEYYGSGTYGGLKLLAPPQTVFSVFNTSVNATLDAEKPNITGKKLCYVMLKTWTKFCGANSFSSPIDRDE